MKLSGSQLLKKLFTCYGTRRFITTITTARQLSLFWPRSIQSMLPPPHPFMKIHFNIILQSIPRYSKWSLSFGLPHQNPISTFATCTAHLIHLYLIIRIAFGEEYILLSTLISNMVSHRFSLNVSGINSDPKFKIFITALAGSSKQHYMTKQR